MEIRMIPQSLVKCFFNSCTTHPPEYLPCLLHQLLLEVNKGQFTGTHTRWWHRLDHTLHTLYHVWPKKAAVDHQSSMKWFVEWACGSCEDGQWHGAPPLSQRTPPSAHSSDCLHTWTREGCLSCTRHVLSWCAEDEGYWLVYSGWAIFGEVDWGRWSQAHESSFPYSCSEMQWTSDTTVDLHPTSVVCIWGVPGGNVMADFIQATKAYYSTVEGFLTSNPLLLNLRHVVGHIEREHHIYNMIETCGDTLMNGHWEELIGKVEELLHPTHDLSHAHSTNHSIHFLMVNSGSKAFLSCTWKLHLWWYSGKSPTTLVIHRLFPAVEVMGSNPAPPFSRPHCPCQALVHPAGVRCTLLSAPSELSLLPWKLHI